MNNAPATTQGLGPDSFGSNLDNWISLWIHDAATASTVQELLWLQAGIANLLMRIDLYRRRQLFPHLSIELLQAGRNLYGRYSLQLTPYDPIQYQVVRN